ncbi:CBS domain-containing protein [Lampropedia puyangensis]|uniref:CBS domain-containing protein n=1 Tax=Lampropedia puyangensis TaxID=1330072 RepID=A0A4S8EYK0_9BURK|nr:DUF294 nucleotidyltransferase-like domain-containing protein [Lampropedia puyangensis]THT99668.1 CBS domain-containing protein [Lampropedia puyangensis]
MSKKDTAHARQAKLAVTQNVQALLAFLRQYPPFDAMAQSHVLELLHSSRLVFFAQGQIVLGPDDGPVAHCYVLRQGAIVGKREPRPEMPEADDVAVHIHPGDGFPYGALLAERASRRTYTAQQDSFCLQLPQADFARLLERSVAFRQFALQGLSGLLGRIGLQMQAQAAQSFSGASLLATPLAQLLGPHPVACAAQTTVRDAVACMEECHSTSIGVVDAQSHLLGIFTLRDLRALVAEPGADLAIPIADVMAADPKALASSATAFDATILMTQHHFGHVCVLDEHGRFKGVVSERDLLALQRVDVVQLARLIRRASSVEDLALVRGSITKLVADMLAQGGSAEQVLRLVTQLNDHTVERVIELMLHKYGDPGIEFGWIAFGSEARGEQTLLTDQDNGLIFQAQDQAQARVFQARLLPLAQAINQGLDACGLAWCKGNVMASNPDLCLADFQWASFMARMMRSGSPQDLLHAVIFLDARLVWGADAGFSQMRRQTIEILQHDSAFQRLMADLALQREPAGTSQWSQWTHKLAHALGKSEARLDLKTQALALFVDAIRILALAHGIDVASTVLRLRRLVEIGVLEPQRAQAYEHAFSYLQQLRLAHHQAQLQEGIPLDNALPLSSLNTLDQRVLRGVLLEAERLQQHLRVRYQL